MHVWTKPKLLAYKEIIAGVALISASHCYRVRYVAGLTASFSHSLFACRGDELHTFCPEYSGDGVDIRRCGVFFGPSSVVEGSWAGDNLGFLVELDELLDTGEAISFEPMVSMKDTG